MKKNLTALVLALAFLSGSMKGYAPSSRTPIPPPGPSISISEYGTLLEIFDAEGNSRFGKLDGDGFQMTYRIHGKTMSVSAVGAKEAQGLKGGQPYYDGPSARVTLTTVDNALEITSDFILDEKTKELIIDRRIKNISDETVNLQLTHEFVDPKLVVAAQPRTRRTNLDQLVLAQVKAGLRDPDTADCLPRKCPPPPSPCGLPLCPGGVGYLRPRLITDGTGRGNQITLRWKAGIPLTSKSSGGATPRSTSEAHFVVHVKMRWRADQETAGLLALASR